MRPPVHPCGAPGLADDRDVVCDLGGGHDGPHADLYDGWEWAQG